MSRNLVLEEVSKTGTHEVGRLQSGDVVIGREPDQGGISVTSKGVSRNHGLFTKIRNHWFYKDLGSTNGSWVNGNQTKPGEWKIVRSGAVLQLGDALIRVSADQDRLGRDASTSAIAAVGGRSLIVFQGDEFVDEFLIPEYGHALVVGGSQADLALEGDIFELPSLVVERRADKICAYSKVKEVEPTLNEVPFNQLVPLTDGDVVRVGNFNIILNDPIRSMLTASDKRESPVQDWSSAEAAPSPDAPTELYEMPEPQRPKTGRHIGTFGTVLGNEIEQTISLQPEEMEAKLAGADRLPSMRYNIRGVSDSNSSSIEDRIIIAVGVFLFVILCALVLWWVVV